MILYDKNYLFYLTLTRCIQRNQLVRLGLGLELYIYIKHQF